MPNAPSAPQSSIPPGVAWTADTNTLAELGDTKVALLMGQYTGQLGVIDMTMDDRYQIQVTNLERTLIDMTVRPTYSGGVFEVLNAFRSAARLGLSVNKLSALLQNLEFVYPYHQAIGLRTAAFHR
mgnify:CR=1 FL=1